MIVCPGRDAADLGDLGRHLRRLEVPAANLRPLVHLQLEGHDGVERGLLAELVPIELTVFGPHAVKPGADLDDDVGAALQMVRR